MENDEIMLNAWAQKVKNELSTESKESISRYINIRLNAISDYIAYAERELADGEQLEAAMRHLRDMQRDINNLLRVDPK